MDRKQNQNTLRLNKDQRKYLADKLASVANIILGGFAVGQILWEKPFQLWLFSLGIGGYTVLLITGLFVLKGDGENGPKRT